MRGFSKGSAVFASGTIKPKAAPAADAVMPVCVDCDEPIDACVCDEQPIGPMDAVDMSSTRLAQDATERRRRDFHVRLYGRAS